MKTILVVANETLGGASLLDKIREHAADGDVRVAICVPRTRPRHGNIIYDEAVYDAAQVRIELARSVLRAEGIDSVGEPFDPDPYAATMDAVAEYEPDEIIISTFPATSSGWLRRDLIERVTEATRIPVEHVVADIDKEGLPFGVTLLDLLDEAAAADRLVGEHQDLRHGSISLSSAGAPAGCLSRACAGGWKIPCWAPGTPYSYGPPTTVGTRSKLNTGGGEETCHSSVSARHGFAGARAPPRHEATML